MRKYIFCTLLTAFLATPFTADAANLNFGISAFTSKNSEIQLNYNNAESFTAYKNEFTVDLPCNTLEINWVEGKVKIDTDSKVEKITISEKANKPVPEELCMHYKVADNTISLCYAKQGKHNLNGLSKELLIKLPKNTQFKEVYVTSSSAEVDAEIPTAKTIKLFNMSGDTELETNSVEKLEATATSGEIDIEAKNAENIEITEVSGNTELEISQAPKNINARSSSGNIKIELPLGTTVNSKINSMSGKIINDFPQKDAGECKVTINSMSGVIKLQTR